MTEQVHISGYKFIAINQLLLLQKQLFNRCQELNIYGTILLSQEGININLAGSQEGVKLFKIFLTNFHDFNDLTFHQTICDILPYQKLKIKIKPEIITMRHPKINPEIQQAPLLTPQELKQWLDEERDFTLLDTRNEYEVRFGTFKKAIHPHLENFSAFIKTSKLLDTQKPIVTFCTGGIRCEKAALLLLQEGFQNVYQLQKGILNYFKEVGNAHYDGECFVFDQRIAVDENLQITGTQQCKTCQGPVKKHLPHNCEIKKAA